MSAAAEAGQGSRTRRELIWNFRKCEGTNFHVAALEGDHASVEQWLQEDPGLLNTRFTYETLYKGQSQEGSGEAIHLAASRGHEDVVKTLLSANARLDAQVTRDGRNHYDVLHAAVFAEGHGGSLRMVKYLLDLKAPLQANLDNKWPLHLAFQTGATHLLSPLRKQVEDLGMGDILKQSMNGTSPLQTGIQAGHISNKELALAASLTTHSLRTFIDYEPRCLRVFLARLQGHVSPAKLAKHVHGEDIAKVLRESPDAAATLLDAMMSPPEVQDYLHPLPARVSLAPRNFMDRLQLLMNPTLDMLVFYQKDKIWKFDSTRHEAPKWHSMLTSKEWGKPFSDARVRVCYAPNLACPEFFAALVDAAGGDNADETSLRLFREPVVRGAIHHVWWNGTFKSDVLRNIFSLWGLLLLVYDSVLVGPGTMVSVDFIFAKGIVDGIFLATKARGCVLTGSCFSSMCNKEHFWDLCRCVFPVLLPYATSSKSPIQIAVVFIYWGQVFGFFTFSEYIAKSILPITRLAKGLIPAIVMTMVWFCAFVHAFQVVRDSGETSWITNLLKSYATLITSELPTDSQTSGLEMVLNYLAVTVFTVFLLNIFIGVVGEQFQRQKEMSSETFRLVQAGKCWSFLCTARALPNRLMGKKCAFRLAALAAAVGFGVQLGGLARGQPMPWTRAILVACMCSLELCTFQDRAARWSRGARISEEADWHYLWLVLPTCHEEDPEEAVGDKSPTGGSDIWQHRW